MHCVLIMPIVGYISFLCLSVLSLHGCGGASDAHSSTSTTMVTTTTTTQTTTTQTTFDGTIQLTFSRLRRGQGGGSDACRVASNQIKFSAGVAVDFTAADFMDSQTGGGCVEVDCDMHTGNCAQVTVSEVTDPSNVNVNFKPISFGIASGDLCDGRWHERTVAKANKDALLCDAYATQVICVEPKSFPAYNMWKPDDSFPVSEKVCSDANPRRRCLLRGLQWKCWEVANSDVCPSEPGSCTLDPTCDCGEGMVKTTIVGGNNYSVHGSGKYESDSGTWCWRCDKETHVSCAAQTGEFIFSPDECTSQSCDCSQSASWPAPLIRQTWYTDSNRTSFVGKGTPGAIPCYTCGGDGAFYTKFQPMNITYTVGVSVTVSSPSGAELGGNHDSAEHVSTVVM